MGSLQKTFLQKVEELTLYAIEQKERADTQQETIDALREQVQKQQRQIERQQRQIDALLNATEDDASGE